MRAILGLALALVTAVMPLAAASQDMSAVLQELPGCATKCLVDGITHSTCATNLTPECICGNVQLQTQVSVCVSANCTIRQALFTKNLTDTSCGVPMRDRGATYDATSIILAVISCSVVAARIVFKLLATRSLSSDDIVVLVLVIIAVPSVVITHYGTTPNGVGRDIWTLSPKTITDFLFYFYLMAIFYFTQVMMVKLCLLLFYLRIFPGTTVRRLLWGTVVFTVLFGVVFFFLAIFQCTPVSHFWDHWDGEHEGKCLDLNAIAWANAGISIALDVWMLAIPLAQLKTLNLHWKKKIGVGLMFGVGTFVTIVSIIRLQALVVFGKSSNATWDNFPVSLWSTVEINVGIICTCMPTLRLMLVRAFPALGAGSSYGRRTYYHSEGIKGLSSKGGRPGRTHENLSSTSKLRGEEPAPVKPLAIIRQQTFAVRYDDDEASLVEMRALDRNGQKQVGDGLT